MRIFSIATNRNPIQIGFNKKRTLLNYITTTKNLCGLQAWHAQGSKFIAQFCPSIFS